MAAREERICAHCSTGEIETEMHFLLFCEKYSLLRNTHFGEIVKKIRKFHTLTPEEKVWVLLGEGTAAPLPVTA